MCLGVSSIYIFAWGLLRFHDATHEQHMVQKCYSCDANQELQSAISSKLIKIETQLLFCFY